MQNAMRYSMVLWGYPPHRAEKVLPEIVRLLDHASGRSLTWYLEGQPEVLVTASPTQWSDVAREQRDEEDGSLSVFCGSPSGLSIGLTLDYPSYVRGFDVLSISLGADHLFGTQTMLGFDQLYTLCRECIRVFHPFWARVYDKKLVTSDAMRKLHLSTDVTKVPDTIHWLNFFDEEMVARLGGKNKLLAAPAFAVKQWENPSGIFLILQREPFDFCNLKHRQRQEEIVHYLELKQLHGLYPKRYEDHLPDRLSSDS